VNDYIGLLREGYDAPSAAPLKQFVRIDICDENLVPEAILTLKKTAAYQ
jgi:hypothetical protein